MREFIYKYRILFIALALIVITFPDVIFGRMSLAIVDTVPFDGTNAFVNFPDGSARMKSLYPELSMDLTQGYFDMGGSLWQSESKIPYMKYVIEKGENPFWNPYQGAGTPGPESMVDIKFSPYTLLSALLGGSSLAINFAILFFWVLGCYGMIKLCYQVLELPLIAGVAAAMAYLLNGFQTSGPAANYVQSYALFPIYLYALCAWVKYGTTGRFIIAYLSAALILCLTFVPTTIMVLMTTTALALGYVLQQSLLRKQQLYKAAMVIAAPLCGLVLTACLYLPLVHAVFLGKVADNYSARVFYPATTKALLSMFTPKHLWNSYNTMDAFLYDPNNPGYIGNVVFHLGIVGGLLALLSLQKNIRSKPLLLCAWVIAIAALLRIFGLPLYATLVSALPLIGNFGEQYMWVIVMVCFPILAGYGMAVASQGKISVRKSTIYYLAFLFALLAYDASVFPLSHLGHRKTVHLLVFLAFCSGVYAIVRLENKPLYIRYLPLLLLGLSFFEYNYYMNHARAVRVDVYNHAPDYVSYIKEHIDNQRILNIGYQGLPAEQAGAFQIQDVSVMTLNVPTDYIDFYYNHLLPKEYRFADILTFLQAKDTAKLNLRLTSSLGVKYILVQKDWPVWKAWLQQQGLKLAFTNKMVDVYENPAVWPRAFFTAQSLDKLSIEAIEAGTIDAKKVIPATITSYKNAHVTIKVNAPKAGMLVLTDNWFPDWHARVNGKDVEVKKVFGAFRGVPVPKGQSDIKFDYRNPAVTWGLRISMAAAVITALLGLLALSRRRITVQNPA